MALGFIASVFIAKYGPSVLDYFVKESPNYEAIQKDIDWTAVASRLGGNDQDVKSICSGAFYTITSAAKDRAKDRATALGIIAYFYSTGKYSEADCREYQFLTGKSNGEKVEAIWQVAIKITPPTDLIPSKVTEVVNRIIASTVYNPEVILTHGDAIEAHQEIVDHFDLQIETHVTALEAFLLQDDRELVLLGSTLFRHLAENHRDQERLLRLVSLLIQKGLYRREHYDAADNFTKEERFSFLFPAAPIPFDPENILANPDPEAVYTLLIEHIDLATPRHQQIVTIYFTDKKESALHFGEQLQSLLTEDGPQNGKLQALISFLINQGFFTREELHLEEEYVDVANEEKENSTTSNHASMHTMSSSAVHSIIGNPPCFIASSLPKAGDCVFKILDLENAIKRLKPPSYDDRPVVVPRPKMPLKERVVVDINSTTTEQKGKEED